MELTDDVKFVKGVGPNRVKLLNKLGIYTLKDLLMYFPRGHEDRSKPKKISELLDGEVALIDAICLSKMSEIRIRKGLTLYKLIVRDDTGTCQITWYNQSYLKTRFKLGNSYMFYGKVSNKFGKIEMNAPVFDEEGISKNTGKIIPIYPLTYELSGNVIRQIIENGLKQVEDELEEVLPDYIINQYNLYDINKAIKSIHFPESFNDYNLARRRLVFEELFTMQLTLLNLKNKYAIANDGIEFSKDVKMETLIKKLPFELTNAQKRVLKEINSDMEANKAMNRLLQGDVGSRKNNCSINLCI